ncbi:GNAT family N-acetyltransferase [Bauldia sp.]|uniref:GNAT family N-acetyltransferase n=1 Tax=Bauldia sp. TaxID=2575872 RepID=UPI003BAB8EB3
MQTRDASTPQDVHGAVTIDQRVIGSRQRERYMGSIAENGGLSLAVEDGRVIAFCCLDHRYFFEKPFISLLIVHPNFRRRGVGRGLLKSSEAKGYPELWTSTNRSNAPMQALLQASDWHYCGELRGLDEGDPEMFFTKSL